MVVSNGADVFGAQSEPRAGHYRSRHLSTRAQHLALEGDFTGVRGKLLDQQQGVGRVQTDP
jgi:hypothetical protein